MKFNGMIASIGDTQILDQFDKVKGISKQDSQERTIMTKLLPTIVGPDWLIYKLYTEDKIPSPVLAEYYGLADSSIRSKVLRAKKKIEAFVESMKESEEYLDDYYTDKVALMKLNTELNETKKINKDK